MSSPAHFRSTELRCLSTVATPGTQRSLWLHGGVLVVTFVLSILVAPAWAEAQSRGIQVSGGLDARYTPQRGEGDDLRLEGAFLNVRKVWSDDLGDRWIGVGQADFDDNFNRVRPYQVYLQYKGPLGKWNIRGGHYLLPFGLLATYDTERLLLQGLERSSLGIRKDSGAMVNGRFGSWDYAASVTDGLSDVRFVDSGANPVLTARLAYVRGDSQIGISTLVGNVHLDPEFGIGSGFQRERRAALDATHSFGPLTLRAEVVGGTKDGRPVGGGLVLADYALTPKLELNTRYADWSGGGEHHSPGVGLTYQLRTGLFARAAYSHQFRETNKNVLSVQLYYEFSHQF